jgi:hypothetical protein
MILGNGTYPARDKNDPSNPAKYYTFSGIVPLEHKKLEKVLIFLENDFQSGLKTGFDESDTIPASATARAAYGIAVFDRLNMYYCGTAIACATTRPGTNQGNFKQPHSCSFTNIKIERYTFRGIDLNRFWRTGNVFRNITINNNWPVEASVYPTPTWDPSGASPSTLRWPIDCGFNMGMSEAETTIDQLNVQSSMLKDTNSRAIRVDTCNGLVMGTVHVEGVSAKPWNTGSVYMEINNCTGSIEAIIHCNDPCIPSNSAFLKIGKTYNTFTSDGQEGSQVQKTNNFLRLGVLSLMSLDYASSPADAIGGTHLYQKNYNIVTRDSAIAGEFPFILQVDSYTYAAGKWLDSITYNRWLDAVKNFPISANANIQLLRKTSSGTADSTLIVPFYNNSGTKAKPTFVDLPNPIIGQLVRTQANKVYMCVKSSPSTWVILN